MFQEGLLQNRKLPTYCMTLKRLKALEATAQSKTTEDWDKAGSAPSGLFCCYAEVQVHVTYLYRNVCFGIEFVCDGAQKEIATAW
jgi:hypothetical protein